MPAKPARSTATREYFQPNKIIDSTSQSIDWPEEEDSKPPLSASKSADEEQKQRTPSSTPSDIVLSADMSDISALGELNKKLMDEGMGKKERKEKMLEKKAEGDIEGKGKGNEKE